jgi:hypothetical protein
MSRRRRTLLAIGTLWSFLYTIPFVVFVCVLFVDAIADHKWPVSNRLFIVVWALTAATLVVNFALAYVYLCDLSTNPRAPTQKDKWRFLLLYTGPFATIVYWFRHVRGGDTHWPEIRERRNPGLSRMIPQSGAAASGLLVKLSWSADVGKSAALGLPVQRAAFRPAPSRRSVEVPIERQQEVAPVERHQ